MRWVSTRFQGERSHSLNSSQASPGPIRPLLNAVVVGAQSGRCCAGWESDL
ncbi:hypothetical protein PN498_13385 [Oscillatoria sp. CS-180]|nr:hypothetical protein [Oscillatoria sp. CS-180]